MTERKDQLPDLLQKLDREYEKLKQDPTFHTTWSSSDANVAIQSYLKGRLN